MNDEMNMNEKALDEQRAELIQRMKDLTDQAELEKRAFTEDEDKEFDDAKAQIDRIDSTMKKMDEARALNLNQKEEKKTMENEELTQEELDVRAFANYIRGAKDEQRADANLTYGDNGAVIPTTIVNKILQKIYDLCPIYQMATHYNVKGNVTVPYYDESDGTIEVAYADEFTELTSTSGKFKSIELKGFLAGALTKVSRSLINSSDFDLTNYVVDTMAKKFSRWYSHELLVGTKDKVEGLQGVKLTETAAAADAITADELIDLQELIPDDYQAPAIWIMNRKTRTAIRKLKDANGDYLLNPDLSARWGYTLLGRPVYCDENMPEMAADTAAIYYGDMSGLAVHDTETMDIQILNELFATQHVIGVVGWTEIDSKVEDAQKIAALVMGSGLEPNSLSATATASTKKAKAE